MAWSEWPATMGKAHHSPKNVLATTRPCRYLPTVMGRTEGVAGSSPLCGGAPVLRISAPSQNLPERTYVLGIVLRDWLGVEFSIAPDPNRTTTTIAFDNSNSEIELEEDVLLSTLGPSNPWLAGSVQWVSAGEVCDPSKVVDLRGIPVMAGNAARVLTQSRDAGVHIKGDLLGTVFALLSGFEEAFTGVDEYGRARYVESRLGKANLIEHPVVDELTEVLWSAITALWPRIPRLRPQPRIVPTHDIDNLWAMGGGGPIASLAAGAIHARRNGLSAGGSHARLARKSRKNLAAMDPFFCFEELMDVAEEHQRVSSFFFIPGGTPRARVPMGYYRIGDKRLAPIFRSIHERGHVIGIHPSWASYRNPRQLASEVDALRRATASAGVEVNQLGGRQHYLLWDSQRSPAVWEQAKLSYDSSVGYAEVAGFRAGTSRSYPLWEADERRATTVLERPLIIMDATVTNNMGLHADSHDAIELVARLKRRCSQFGGDFVFLVHNNRLVDPGMRTFYRECLR